jgi:undecaprenyl-phosphate 4-deoxy-4-formamido-L-arabinose transferase
MKLSVVIPVYNSENSIADLVYALFEQLHHLSIEVVLVNDASKDTSEAICESIAESDFRVKFISLRKNAGEHNAVICGLNHATGDYITIIDDDFQNPPSEILALLEEAKTQNKDVVYARYTEKKHSLWRNWMSKLNNVVATWLLNKPHNLYLSSFKLMRREVVEEVIKYQGPFPYLDGLILRCTSSIGSVTVKHENRRKGASNYTFKKLFSLYLNMFINFSSKPIRFFTIAGLCISGLSFAGCIYVLVEKWFLHNTTPGWAFVPIILLFFIGTLFIFLGLLGEYIGKILFSINNTPQYVIKKSVNINTKLQRSYDRETTRVRSHGQL